MKISQSYLFPNDASALESLIQRVSNWRFQTPEYTRLLTRIHSSVRLQHEGRLIVVACSSEIPMPRVRGDITGDIGLRAEPPGPRIPPESVISIKIPVGQTRREQSLELHARYREALNAPGLRYRTRPQFISNDLICPPKRAEMGMICRMLANQQPSLVILEHAENLEMTGSSRGETVAAILQYEELARRSGVTHVLFGKPQVILPLFADPMLSDRVEVLVLSHPDLRTETGKAHFSKILEKCDAALAEHFAFKLVDHMDQIHHWVGGDPYRLSKWISRALKEAHAITVEMVDWNLFQSVAPRVVEIDSALKDFDEIHRFLAPQIVFMPKIPSRPKAPARKSSLKPGKRIPTRDPFRPGQN